jgi:biotin carboxyl carrier protein
MRASSAWAFALRCHPVQWFRPPDRQCSTAVAPGKDRAESMDGAIVSPMPGRVVTVGQGEHVTRGAALVIIEAMKMEVTLTAPFAGTVADVPVGQGQQVAEGMLLIRLEPQEA